MSLSTQVAEHRWWKGSKAEVAFVRIDFFEINGSAILIFKIIYVTESICSICQDEKVIVFEDIRPAAQHHYLICPNEHIPNAKCLTRHDIPLGIFYYCCVFIWVYEIDPK